MATTKSAALKKASTQATTAVAVRKPNAGNLVSIQDALKAQAAAMGDRIQPATGNMIRATQDKKIILPDGTKTEGPLQLVVLDFVTMHNFYPAGFDEKNIVPPDCYAIGVNPKAMTPMANSPNIQAKNCQECPNNEWGSKGDGKACNNERLLAVMPPDADDDTPIWLLKVSKTAIKGFDGFVAGLRRVYQSVPIQFVVTVGFNDSKTYPSWEFSDPQPNPNLEVHFGRQGEAIELLNRERDVSGWEPPARTPARKGAARR